MSSPLTFLGSMLNFFLPIAIFRFRCKVLLQKQGGEQKGQCLSARALAKPRSLP